jgi:SAM-dependent methyltransferase
VDFQERLTPQEASAHTLVGAEHVHRYEFAAELCAGLRVADVGCGTGYGSGILSDSCPAVTGVDNDAGAIETARRHFGGVENVQFEVADGVEFLGRPLRESFDAIVMFEVLEHLNGLEEAVAALRRHAEDGLRLVISVPNSRAFEEKNPYHRSDFSFDAAMSTFKPFPNITFLYQFLAEGSLIRPMESVEQKFKLVLAERGEPEYANHFIACANFDGSVQAVNQVRAQLAIAPTYNRHMANLERANRELRLANARLGKNQIGVADSAAASLIGRLRGAEEELEAARKTIAHYEHVRDVEAESKAWIDNLHEQISTLKAEVGTLNREIELMRTTRVWRTASRYWNARDRLRSRLHRG